MIDEYNLYKNEEFYGTFTVFQIAEKFKIEPERVEAIYKNGGKINKIFRISKILRPYEKKPSFQKKDIFKEWEEVTSSLKPFFSRKSAI